MGTLFKTMSGIDIVYIPYKGAAPSITDLLGGRTQMTFDALTVLYPLIQDGKLRALAVTSLKRWSPLPEVPTMIESGYAGFPSDAWAGVLAPNGTPAGIVAKLNVVINEGMTSEDAKGSLAKLSAVASLGSPQDFAAWIAAESPRWTELVRLAGATVEAQ
jgi:tripartite-type tricarboxylate transporter receptor subunit TctC